MKTTILLLSTILLMAVSISAEIIKVTIEYVHDGVTLEGYLAYDDSSNSIRPGVLVVHEWKGLNEYARMRADMLAGLGYAAFAPDIYGKGVRPETNQEAGEQAGKFKGNRGLLRDRVKAGLDQLRTFRLTDGDMIAAIGYCFGGTTVLELARNGADIKGVVSFHGGLGSPNPEDATNIKCRVLVCHGADDFYVTPEEMTAFQNEMRVGKVDWQLNAYGHAVHGFSNPAAGDNHSSGYAYMKSADKRSWNDMLRFFDDIFAE